MPLPERLYEAAAAAAWPAARAASLLSPRLRRAVRGRADSEARLAGWAASSRDPARPLVWVHAPSVGEALMAQAVIAELRRSRPDLQVVFTHFSPSAERVVAEVGADVWGYVPWDTKGDVRRALAALRPAVLVFVRTDVWPVLAREAEAAGARLVLINAVLSEGSGRLSGPARGLMTSTYRRLDAVGAVSDEHGARYRRLGVPADRIHATGDARFDQVWSRIEARGLFELRGAADAVDRAPESVRPIWRALYEPDLVTVVAGSTWPADEKVLLPPLTVLRRDHRVRVVVAPHEPTPGHLEALERRLDRLALPHARLGALLAAGVEASGGSAPPTVGVSGPASGTAPTVVVVDRLGVLADLYALAEVAYVGGGFGRAGLHSIVEPAALGVPVLFGPAHGNAREAGALAARGGGFVVTGQPDVEHRLRGFLENPAAPAAAGAIAREFVRSETGAAARNAGLVLTALARGGPRGVG
jgi:3-deoxy-D-manno-octulosonic-acid transferase